MVKYVDLTEFVYSQDVLAQARKEANGNENWPNFEFGFRQGELNRYIGTHVAFIDGVLAGQSTVIDYLRQALEEIHPGKNYTIFLVPKDPADLTKCFERRIEGTCKNLEEITEQDQA